jgi:hypothetical protein
LVHAKVPTDPSLTPLPGFFGVGGTLIFVVTVFDVPSVWLASVAVAVLLVTPNILLGTAATERVLVVLAPTARVTDVRLEGTMKS